MLLETEGYECETIFDGGQAVSEIRRMNPDIVILDVMLPGLSGVEVCSQIREFYHGAILMLTGCDDDITELASFKQGADDYVTKPIKTPFTARAYAGTVKAHTAQRNRKKRSTNVW